jgi:type I restriction enzyme M protein
MQNISAIIWLCRGQQDRFLKLLKDYLGSICSEVDAAPEKLAAFKKTLGELQNRFDALVKAVEKEVTIEGEKKKALVEAVEELNEAAKLYETDRTRLLADTKGFQKRFALSLPEKNDSQQKARRAFDPIAEHIRDLVKQEDLLYKLAARVADLGGDFNGVESVSTIYDRRFVSKLEKQLDEERQAAVDRLRKAVYFHRQVAWLQDRFPKAELEAVPGLVKLVDLKEIEAADWSLTPGRYVGVSPPKEDEDFDFEQTMRDIHTELADLNKEAVDLAAKIQKNFEELGI